MPASSGMLTAPCSTVRPSTNDSENAVQDGSEHDPHRRARRLLPAGVLPLRTAPATDEPISNREGAGTEQDEDADAAHRLRLEGLVDQLIGDGSEQHPRPDRHDDSDQHTARVEAVSTPRPHQQEGRTEQPPQECHRIQRVHNYLFPFQSHRVNLAPCQGVEYRHFRWEQAACLGGRHFAADVPAIESTELPLSGFAHVPRCGRCISKRVRNAESAGLVPCPPSLIRWASTWTRCAMARRLGTGDERRHT